MKRIKSTLRTCFKANVGQALQPIVRPLSVVLFAVAGLSVVIPFASQIVRAQVEETPTERPSTEQSAPRETLSAAELTRFRVDVEESLQRLAQNAHCEFFTFTIFQVQQTNAACSCRRNRKRRFG